jgi:hypothetical protein
MPSAGRRRPCSGQAIGCGAPQAIRTAATTGSTPTSRRQERKPEELTSRGVNSSVPLPRGRAVQAYGRVKDPGRSMSPRAGWSGRAGATAGQTESQSTLSVRDSCREAFEPTGTPPNTRVVGVGWIAVTPGCALWYSTCQTLYETLTSRKERRAATGASEELAVAAFRDRAVAWHTSNKGVAALSRNPVMPPLAQLHLRPLPCGSA